MPSYPLTITQTFTVTRTIEVVRRGLHLLDAVERQSLDFKPDFDDPAWESDWYLRDEEVLPVNAPEGWDEVEDYDPEYLDDVKDLNDLGDLLEADDK